METVINEILHTEIISNLFSYLNNHTYFKYTVIVIGSIISLYLAYKFIKLIFNKTVLGLILFLTVTCGVIMLLRKIFLSDEFISFSFNTQIVVAITIGLITLVFCVLFCKFIDKKFQFSNNHYFKLFVHYLSNNFKSYNYINEWNKFHSDTSEIQSISDKTTNPAYDFLPYNIHHKSK